MKSSTIKILVISTIVILVLCFLVPEIWSYIAMIGIGATAGQIKASKERQDELLQDLNQLKAEAKNLDNGVEEKTPTEEEEYWKNK